VRRYRKRTAVWATVASVLSSCPFRICPNTSEAGRFAVVEHHGPASPALTVEPHAGFHINFDYAAPWPHCEAEVIYLPPGIAVPGTAESGQFIGHQAQINVNSAAPNLSMQAACSRLFANDSLERAGGRSPDYFLSNLP
jgi:hypothetical protein